MFKYGSPGLALGAIALVIALGGTSVAGDAQTAAKKKVTARTNVTQVTQTVTLPPQATNAGVLEQTVNCPAGTTVTGGGGVFPAGVPLTTSIELFESGPVGNGWHVRFNNNQATEQPGVVISAICIKNKLKVK